MKKKLPIIFVSIIAAFVLISGGYGFWEKELTISGTITVTEPAEELSEAPPSINRAPENLIPSTTRYSVNAFDAQVEEDEEDLQTEDVDTSPEKPDQGTEAKDDDPQGNPIVGDKTQPQSEGEEEVIPE